MNDLRIVRLSPKGERTVFDFYRHPIKGIGRLEPNGIAVAPNGVIFTDTYAGNGVANTSALIELRHRGHNQVFWKS